MYCSFDARFLCFFLWRFSLPLLAVETLLCDGKGFRDGTLGS